MKSIKNLTEVPLTVIDGQLRRAVLTLGERRSKRALLRLQTGLVTRAAHTKLGDD